LSRQIQKLPNTSTLSWRKEKSVGSEIRNINTSVNNVMDNSEIRSKLLYIRLCYISYAGLPYCTIKRWRILWENSLYNV